MSKLNGDLLMINARHVLPGERASRMVRTLAPIALLLGLTLVVSACTQEDRDDIRDNLGTVTITQPGDGEDGTETPTPTTAPPETSTTVEEAPTTTTAAGSDEGDGIEPSSALLVLALVVIGGLIIFLIGRRSSRPTTATQVVPPAPPVAAPTWQDRTRSVYTEGRWILDNTDQRMVDLRAAAIGGDPRAMEADREMRRRLDAFMADIYEVETEVPTASLRRALRDLGDGARPIDSAIDSLVAAAPTDAGSPSETVAWSESRRRFEASLDRLADELRSSGG